MEKQIALAGAVLAGQMTLAGLVLVYQGLAVSWWRSQSEPEKQSSTFGKRYRSFLFTTTLAVVITLIATVVPILTFTSENYSVWSVPAVLALSIGLVIVIAIQGYKLFQIPSSPDASKN